MAWDVPFKLQRKKKKCGLRTENTVGTEGGAYSRMVTLGGGKNNSRGGGEYVKKK